MDNSHPIFESPIKVGPAQPVAWQVELIAEDVTGVQVILIQGNPGPTLDGLSANIPEAPGELVDTGGAILARLTPDELYAFGKTAAGTLPQAAELDLLFAASGHFAHATDLTHGKAVMKLAGPAASEVLSKICGLNFAQPAFPSGRVKLTSAAKVKTLIARVDDNETQTYYLHVERPLGQYFWDTVWDAGQEFGIALADSGAA